MLRKILIALIVILIIAQFFRPEKNISNDNTHHISTKYPMPDDVKGILEKACYNCHSNKTDYPWYASIQPFAAWIANHVKDGKRHLNFSEFTTRPIAVQNHKLEEVIETVKENEMPLSSYTWLGSHPEAKISVDERNILINWAQDQMDSLKANYPPDSLILKRPPAPPKQ